MRFMDCGLGKLDGIFLHYKPQTKKKQKKLIKVLS